MIVDVHQTEFSHDMLDRLVYSTWPDIDASRRLMLLARAQVVSLRTSGNRVSEIELLVNGQQQFLRPPLLSPDCTVVLAASTIECTRLALDSLPAPTMGPRRMGSNLMSHLRSDITARIRRSAIPGLSPQASTLEIAAFLVRRTTSDGHAYHFQITASAGIGSDANLFYICARFGFVGCAYSQPRSSMDSDYHPCDRTDDWASRRTAGGHKAELD